MESNYLFPIFIFLLAACLVVPISSRFRLGSVLGYLIAGIIIGPYCMGLIRNPEQILHFAEFGVIMMLFMIGLELEPSNLWKLRKTIFGLGSLQVLFTTGVFSGLAIALGYTWQNSIGIGMAMALSSTALVLQILDEKGLLHTTGGEASFSVLLLQDLAVIPMLILLPLLAPFHAVLPTNSGWLSTLPDWLHAGIIAFVIICIIVAGRYFSSYLFRFVAKTNLREVFTATALGLVIGITLLMKALGSSPGLGAFIAGVVLANSEYKRTLETEIAPFKGLLLGLFFIAIGMGMNFNLLFEQPLHLFGFVAILILLKMIILSISGYIFGLRGSQNILFAVALAQGGEFAFVLMQYASTIQVLSNETVAFLILATAVSMAITPVLLILYERYVMARFMSKINSEDYDQIDEQHNPVILAGYGRFGQVVGRFLTGQGVKITILEKDPDQVALLRKFGIRGYYGDASRLDLLHNAGATHAKVLVIAVDDADKCLEIVHIAKIHFPKLKIYARARNRRHAYELHKAGVDFFKRETFDSALTMAQEVMKIFGLSEEQAKLKAQQFATHDEKTLRASFAFFEQEPELISFMRQATQEMERILQQDSGKREK